jgi:hypothetical protein
LEKAANESSKACPDIKLRNETIMSHERDESVMHRERMRERDSRDVSKS